MPWCCKLLACGSCPTETSQEPVRASCLAALHSLCVKLWGEFTRNDSLSVGFSTFTASSFIAFACLTQRGKLFLSLSFKVTPDFAWEWPGLILLWKNAVVRASKEARRFAWIVQLLKREYLAIFLNSELLPDVRIGSSVCWLLSSFFALQ